MSTAIDIPTVNYHLWKPCNMRCKFCFAAFKDIGQHILPKGHLGRENCMLVVESLAQAGFRKINFAGGEPTLCPCISPSCVDCARCPGRAVRRSVVFAPNSLPILAMRASGL